MSSTHYGLSDQERIILSNASSQSRLDYYIRLYSLSLSFSSGSSVNHAVSGHDELFAFQLQFLNLLLSLPSADEAEIWEHPESGPVRHEPRQPVTGAPLHWYLDTQEA